MVGEPSWTGKVLGKRVAIGAVAAVGVILLILLPFTPLHLGLAFHQVCKTGPVVESEALWTPWLVVDSPFGGIAFGTANITNPVGKIVSTGPMSVSNGSAVAEFTLNIWRVQQQSLVWVYGPGVSQACSGPYLVSFDRVPLPWPTNSSSNFLLNVSLLGAGNTSDATQPNAITTGGHSSVIFGVNFTINDNYIDTCPGAGITEKVTVRHEAIGVPVNVPGMSGVIAVQISVEAFYVYGYSASPGGVWYRMFAPWGALSFEWAGCPS